MLANVVSILLRLLPRERLAFRQETHPSPETRINLKTRRPRGPFLTSPLGTNFDPRGEIKKAHRVGRFFLVQETKV
jgi:hypothetical protein